MFKLLALDLDGTLMNSENKLSNENKKWIQYARKKGCYILLISGRPYASMEMVAKELELDECMIVAMAGHDIREYPSGVSLASSCLSKKQVAALQILATKINCYLQVFCLDGSYYFQEKTKYSDMYEDYFKYSGQQADLPGGIMAEAIWENMIDAYSDHANKGTAVKFVAENLGISKEQIIACGDESIDLPMFEEAGLSVAMGNATDKVKQAADVITFTNDENGVAEVIKRYI